MKKKPKLTMRQKYVAEARKRYQDAGQIEIDDNAKISISSADKGAYVQAWVWVYKTEIGK